ncbi:transposable element Tcb2 transposase [Trichonephila clavipes]|nr:transposable element Tcb2 transposase [Trichonephila clavipes]
MSSRHHIDDFMRGRIIGKMEEGRKITDVAREFDIAHSVSAVEDCLDSEGIQRLVWPARSPDLNPIENVWDSLGWQVAGQNYPPTNKNTVIRALTEEWDKLPQQLLDNVAQSMVRHVECCITLHGGHISY